MEPSFWAQHRGLLFLAGVVVLGAVAALAWWWRRPRPAVTVPPAGAIREALAALRDGPETEERIREATRLFRRYLQCTLNLPGGELTSEELVAGLGRHPAVPADLGAAVADFLRDSDARCFSPSLPSAAPGLVARAWTLVSRIDARRASGPPPVLPPDSPAPTVIPGA